MNYTGILVRRTTALYQEQRRVKTAIKMAYIVSLGQEHRVCSIIIVPQVLLISFIGLASVAAVFTRCRTEICMTIRLMLIES